MATLLLSTVGSAIAGPLGGIVGTFVGSAVDRSVLGGPRRQGPRLTDLAVQSSAYGEAIPRLYGTIRVAGNIIWSSGLHETKHSSGGKTSGGRTTSYTYSASLAVAVSARPILGIRRIWADGKLIRNEGGEFLVATSFRVHAGGEGQAVDPLIAAAEGTDSTPAYRGLAYAVFEDLQLAEFANRIPLLTFEVESDAAAPALGTVVADLFAASALPPPEVAAVNQPVAGFGVGRQTSTASVLEMIETLQPFSVRSKGPQLEFVRDGSPAALIPTSELGTTPREENSDRARTRWERQSGAAPAEVTVSFFDPALDYQGGLQRAHREGATGAKLHHELPAVMSSGEAKRLSEDLSKRFAARRSSCRITLPYRYTRLQPGDRVALAGDPTAWRVRAATLEQLVCDLELEAIHDAIPASSRPSDAGRINPNPSAVHGPTVLRVLDLPAFTGDAPSAPRVWFAASGPSPAWRRAEILVSTDGGGEYRSVAQATVPATMGELVDVLRPGIVNRWDHANAVEVTLLGDEMWLEARSAAAVLAGANLALVGDELLHFREAVAVGARRFRLSGLLRGRFGTERAVGVHRPGEAFILLDPLSLTSAEVPSSTIGTEFLVKAVGPTEIEGEVPAQRQVVQRNAVLPLSPVHLRAARAPGGDIVLSWVRRSRQGYAWLDGTDVPLAEESERYAVTLLLPSGNQRRLEATSETLRYTAAAQAADAGAAVTRFTASVAQVSPAAGPGDAAERTFDLSA